jgi:hypothetical protein
VTIFSHLRFPITRVPTDCCFQVKSSPCRIRRTVLDNPLLRLQILSEGWIAATLYVAYLKVFLIAQQKCQEVNIPISLAKTWKGNTKFRFFPDSGYFFPRFQVKQKDMLEKSKMSLLGDLSTRIQIQNHHHVDMLHCEGQPLLINPSSARNP